MKRYLTLLVVALLILAAVPAQASRSQARFPITFNGHPVAFDTAPENVNGRMYVPFRAIFEKMGATVTWDGDTRTVTADRDGVEINLTIGKSTAYVNGRAKTLDAAPYISNDSTMVPLRFIAEALGAEVNFDPATTKISIVDRNYPQQGGKLFYAMWNKVEGKLNPVYNDDTYGSWIMGTLYDGLWSYNNKFEPTPKLAEGWEWNADNTRLTFYIRPGVKFFDGKELNADDVIFTFKSMMHPKYSGARGGAGWALVKGYEDYNKGITGETASDFEKGFVTATPIAGLYKLDDYTVVFDLSQVDATFFTNQTVYGIMDSSKYSKIPVQDWGTANDPYNTNPNGTGPFKMEKYVDGQQAVVVANPNYWGGKPYVDRIIFRVVAADVAVGEFQNGTLDIGEIEADTLEAYRPMKNVKVNSFPDLVYQMWFFNTAKGPTADKNIRQALAYGVDRNAIIHNLLKDQGGTMYTPIHPLQWAYSDDVAKYDYNPQKAGQILDADGWMMGSDGYRYKDGKKLTVHLMYPNTGNPVRIATAPVVQQMEKKIGIDIVLDGYDFGTVSQKLFDEQDYETSFMGWSVNVDPDQTGMWDKASTVLSGNNPTGWWTPESERLLMAGRSTNDIMERADIYAQWQKLWSEDCPSFIFYAKNTNIISTKRVQAFDPGPWGYLWNQEELWLKQ
ncbi:MAG: ABC transporter substrate-binding protein [Mycobacterium leprae]